MIDAGYIDKKHMALLNIEDIVTATGGRIICGGGHSFTGVSIDSRTIREGELFIPLTGNRFDGHAFLTDALAKAQGALVSRLSEPRAGKTLIQVDDTLKALQDIAHYIRLQRHIPVVAVTGSNGKTTTKELSYSILSSRYKVTKNTGNFNNHIGLPLSLIRMREDDEVVVLEMGASAQGEIRQLCDIAVPTCAVLTNIGQAHLEGFGTLETTRRTKLEILEYVKTAIVNADDLFLMEGVQQSGFRGMIIRYGIDNPADISADGIQLHETGSSFMLHTGEGRAVRVTPRISGRFNIYNILAAVSVGTLFAVDILAIKEAVDSFPGVPMRLEYREMDGIIVISDAYNANPASMEEAVKELARARHGRSIAVLGDMLELGPYGEEAHRKIGRMISELPVDIFIAVGPLMAFAASEFRGAAYTVNTSREAGKLLKDIWEKTDTVLIKGSRGMQMEKVLEA
jgi:UDP-N-acetylmuramoyl-tripeptide--D-alanyl-D-alanine ligase